MTGTLMQLRDNLIGSLLLARIIWLHFPFAAALRFGTHLALCTDEQGLAQKLFKTKGTFYVYQ